MTKFFSFVQCAVVVLLSMGPVWGTDYIVCESRNNRRSYCDIRDIGNSRIDFSRQLSKASCDYGRSWGLDHRGVWVDFGCRAEFAVRYVWNDYDDDDEHDDNRDRRRDWIAPDRGWRDDDQDWNRHDRDHKDHDNQWNRTLPVERCPSGFEPGKHRCSDAERRKGCKDMRMPGGTTCNSRGWGRR